MRRRRLRWALLLGLGLGLACQGRLADLGQEPRYVYCTPVNGARVIEEDGELGGLVVEPGVGLTFICLCVTLEEAKDQELRDDLNDEAYGICLANAAAMGYAEANDCADWYAKRHWGTYFNRWPPDEELHSCGSESAGGCGMDSDSPMYEQP